MDGRGPPRLRADRGWPSALRPRTRSSGSSRLEPAASEPEGREPWVGALLEASEPRALEALLLAERARTGAWHRVAAIAGKALGEVGRLWSAGAVTIFEEHQASERLSRALARIADGLPLDPEAPRAILICAEGDDHTLGLSLTELVLREAGWISIWAGRRTPLAELGPGDSRGSARGSSLSRPPRLRVTRPRSGRRPRPSAGRHVPPARRWCWAETAPGRIDRGPALGSPTSGRFTNGH